MYFTLKPIDEFIASADLGYSQTDGCHSMLTGI